MPTNYGFYDLRQKWVKVLPLSLCVDDIPQLSRRGIDYTLITQSSQAQEKNHSKRMNTRKQAQDRARPERQPHQITLGSLCKNASS